MPETARRRVLENPISGERIVIHTSGDETDGALLAFDLFLPPGGHVPARHVHPIQEERFTVIQGTLRFRLGSRTILARSGDSVRVPPRTAHWFGNAGSQVAHARVEVRPALRMQDLLETSERLGRAGHLLGTRLPRLADLAALLLEFQRELAVPGLPAAVVRLVFGPLAARRRRPGLAEP